MLELAAEYVMAVPDLTIDDADRLRLSNKRLSDTIKGMEVEEDVEMACMEKEIVELRGRRAPPDTDLVEAFRGAADADGVPGTIVESLTGMMRQMAESQEAANREMQAKHDAEMRELRRAPDMDGAGFQM